MFYTLLITMDEMSKANDLLAKIEKEATAEKVEKVEKVEKIEGTEAALEGKESIKVEDVVITDSTNGVDIGTATIKTDELVEDGKSLWDYAYDAAADELKKKAEEEAMNFIKEDQLPDVELKQIEKEKAIEEITQNLEDIIESKSSKDPEAVLEAMATDFYKRIEKKETEIILLKSKNEDLEKLIKEQQSENLKLKHWWSKVDVSDDFMWSFAVTYQEWKWATEEKEKVNLSKKLATIFLWGTRMIYPELEVQDVLDLISAKREKGLKAIQGLTEWGMRDIQIQEKAREVNRPSPYVFSWR